MLSGLALAGMPALEAMRAYLELELVLGAMAALALLSIVLSLLVTMLVRRAMLLKAAREASRDAQPTPARHSERRRRYSPMRGLPARSVARAASLARARARRRPET